MKCIKNAALFLFILLVAGSVSAQREAQPGEKEAVCEITGTVKKLSSADWVDHSDQYNPKYRQSDAYIIEVSKIKGSTGYSGSNYGGSYGGVTSPWGNTNSTWNSNPWNNNTPDDGKFSKYAEFCKMGEARELKLRACDGGQLQQFIMGQPITAQIRMYEKCILNAN